MKKLPAGFRLRRVFALLAALACVHAARAATFTVTTAADEFNTPSGANVSLREALRDAATAAGADTIGFTSSFNLALTSEIVIADTNVTVDATALATGVIVDGGAGTNRIFSISTGANVTLLGLTLTGGGGVTFAGDGGAIRNNGGTLTLTRCTLANNNAIGDGAAIYNGTGTLTLAQCTLTGNFANDGQGGAIANNEGTLVLTQCTLSGNTSDVSSGGGGAILNQQGTATLTDCTLSGNLADGLHGGGGAIRNDGGILMLTNCTLSGNAARNNGGGIYNDDWLRLNNCIIAGNSATGGADIYNLADTFGCFGANLVQSLFNVGLSSGSGTISPNAPLLAPLGNYGGPTMTMALLPGSPARNAAVGSTATSDQRGFPVVGVPDIGAYEAGTLNSNYNAFIWESLPTTNVAVHAADYDYDGDGASNYNEWFARTDPGSAASVLRITKWERVSVPVVGIVDSITFTTEPGLIYAVFRTDELTVPMVDSSEFHTLGNGFLQTVLVPIPPGVTHRFFQVRIVP